MGSKVFISHSVTPKELGIVYTIANESAKRGASPFIPDRDWNPNDKIPIRIQNNLKNSDYLLAIATSSGFQMEWLNREIEEASKNRKPLLIVADEGIEVPSEYHRIWIDRTDPTKTLHQISEHLENFGKGKDRKTKELLTWIVLGGLLFLLLLGSKE